jgi:hypothetical protein
MRRVMLAAALTVGLASVGAPASAQQNGLVNVDVSNIKVTLDDIISRNNLSVQVPVNAIVQVPIGLAANVCGTTVAVLAAAGSAAQCTAVADNTTQGEAMAIARALQRQ